MASIFRTIATLLASAMLTLTFPASSVWARPWVSDAGSAESSSDAFVQQRERRRDFRRQENDSRQWGEAPPRQQRLSPDERRQLRRDIQDAGREIYPVRR